MVPLKCKSQCAQKIYGKGNIHFSARAAEEHAAFIQRLRRVCGETVIIGDVGWLLSSKTTSIQRLLYICIINKKECL